MPPLRRHDPHRGITVWTPDPGCPLRVQLVRSDEPRCDRDDAAIDRAWAERCARNPALFDGPITSVVAFDPAAGLIRWQRDTYRALAVRHIVATGAVQLSVMALLIAPDERARRCVLMGRRSRDVAVYPGAWEFGPSGGIDPPASCELTPDALCDQLAREIREEIGLAVALAQITPALLVGDEAASSLDLACWVQLDRPAAPDPLADASWEYDEVAWVPIDGLSSWIDRLGPAVCPPTAGVARVLAQLA